MVWSQYQDRIFVVDHDRISCSGGTSTAHVAAYLVKKHLGMKYAVKSMRIMMLDDLHDDTKAQPLLASQLKAKDNDVQRALLIMQQEAENLRTIKDICAQLNIGRRSLERKFQDNLGKSPAVILTEIRLEEAKRLLVETDATITQIAVRTGFFDASHLNKAFKKHFASSASHYRQSNPDTKDRR